MRQMQFFFNAENLNPNIVDMVYQRGILLLNLKIKLLNCAHIHSVCICYCADKIRLE